jgi:hypothetical protein
MSTSAKKNGTDELRIRKIGCGDELPSLSDRAARTLDADSIGEKIVGAEIFSRF